MYVYKIKSHLRGFSSFKELVHERRRLRDEEKERERERVKNKRHREGYVLLTLPDKNIGALNSSMSRVFPTRWIAILTCDELQGSGRKWAWLSLIRPPTNKESSAVL